MRLRLLTVTFLLLAASLVAAPVWNVAPEMENLRAPSVRASGLEDVATVSVRVFDLEDPDTALHEGTLAVEGDAVEIHLPAVGRDTYARLHVWLGTDTTGRPDFVWSTVLRPAGVSLYDYTGSDFLTIPDDFDEYWQRAKDELAAVPMNAEVRDIEWAHTATAIAREVHLDSVGGLRFVARITIPRAAYDADGNVVRQFPAMIVMPGYGAEQPAMDRTASGLVTMSVNPRNHGPSRQYWTAPVEHLVYEIENPEQYYYRQAYMDNLRAAEYLFAMPEVDPTRVGAEGGSQGGLFAIALGALDPRIAVVVSNVTSLASVGDGTLLNQTGTTQRMRARTTDGTPEADATRRSLSYIDASHMATRLRAPLQVNMAGQDGLCHFITGIVILHRLRVDVPREFHLFPDVGHTVPAPMRRVNEQWMRRWLDLEETPSFPGQVLRPPAE